MCDICNTIEKSLQGENPFFVKELKQELLFSVGISIFTDIPFLCAKSTQPSFIN